MGEETDVRPKPMVEIGHKPILWHIMKIYSHYGIQDFVICLGYKGYMIKEYFSNYFLHMSDVTFDIKNNQMKVHDDSAEPWQVTLIDTGMETKTGGRLKRVREHVDDGTFCFTYGDGVANVDLDALVEFHHDRDRLATLTGVRAPGRFGALETDGDRVRAFREKAEQDWINGGFMVVEPEAIDYIDGDQTPWEREPLEGLADDGELGIFQHDGFWHPMDTPWDMEYLNELWEDGEAAWQVWE